MGFVIAPDNFEGTINSTYTDSEWATAEGNYGFIFLPAAGYRSGSNGTTDIYDAGSLGYYWSASPFGDNSACDLYFDGFNVNPNDLDARNRAQPVRLVTEVTE